MGQQWFVLLNFCFNGTNELFDKEIVKFSWEHHMLMAELLIHLIASHDQLVNPLEFHLGPRCVRKSLGFCQQHSWKIVRQRVGSGNWTEETPTGTRTQVLYDWVLLIQALSRLYVLPFCIFRKNSTKMAKYVGIYSGSFPKLWHLIDAFIPNLPNLHIDVGSFFKFWCDKIQWFVFTKNDDFHGGRAGLAPPIPLDLP